MTGTFLRHYMNGEHEQVWTELMLLGPEVRSERFYADTMAVAHETMSRVRSNVEILVPRLRELGYRFGDLEDKSGHWSEYPILEPPSSHVKDYIRTLEENIGVLPISLRTFWEVVGGVNLLGYHPDWLSTFEADPLYIYSLTEDYCAELIEHCEELRVDAREQGEEAGPYQIYLAPDCYHKDYTSGGMPYSIAVPCSDADADFLNEAHETTFVNYLRLCFRWGGFPGLSEVPHEELPLEQLQFLTRDLLPI